MVWITLLRSIPIMCDCSQRKAEYEIVWTLFQESKETGEA